ncbi:acyl-CoA N-acyltransferase [Patellaria atrata CBS 101060]|uniref:Acyl-CoA N-acyltransferase n=1 Tax=Patellaria atrata CBS 101060 TaxID=1346257 RepID=A0A9P4SGF0_9PEZI|nr:acyl-CoA N-acyltransferase [Patellaria atrata CBS 101060]
MSQITPHPLTPSDLPTILTIYFASFTNAFALRAFPHTAPIHAWWSRMLSSELSDPAAVFLKAVTLTSNGSETISWIKGNRAPSTWTEKPAEESTWPEGSDAELCDVFFGRLEEVRRRVMGGRGHWYIELLATSPAHQGKGAASLLLQQIVSLADAEDVAAYIEASPVSVRLYRKFGFEERDSVTVDVTGHGSYTTLCMVRPALSDRVSTTLTHYTAKGS